MTRDSSPAVPPSAGLCARCRHGRAIASRRGSVFVMCGLAATDDRFPRYPRLPVERCSGHERVSRVWEDER